MSSLIAKYSKILCIGLFVFGVSAGSNAACYALPQWTLKTAMLDIGKLNIPLTSKVGDILYTKTVKPFIPEQMTYICKDGGGILSFRITKDYGLAPGFQNVYTTDVPGVGVRFTLISPTEREYIIPFTTNRGEASLWFNSKEGLNIKIIKIAEKTGSGTLAGGIYAEYSGDGDNKALARIMLAGGEASVITTPPCVVSNESKFVQVPLGKISLSMFNGVNSTAVGSNFKIRLNCNVSANTTINTVYLKFDANKKDPNGRDGVILLDDSQTSAKGVGIQITDSQQTPIKFGQDTFVGPALNTYDLNYTARYIQTLNTITPGQANGTAFFTIEYK
ncbi:type 1 fimbrial protein [Pseudomonas sp. MSSRFD41]|uniref:fimbrial protein n=1 Tax=Pseudomonas sp. MSSRFD41 TaxID=1310370 RepID=UPI00163B2124|nr:fimbrial protein [Pseudomonas sp. MSSRFD41]MBC2656651.1 type 1 fimbrial protein [Pseudomonas sp. MSSRFD41]